VPGAGVGAGLDPDADAFVDPTTKGFPAVDRPIRLGAVGSQTWRLADLPLPVMVLRESALAHNLRLMSAFCREHGVELMPHGKTTMAPQLWRRQLEAGATGIAAADTVQARVMAAAGVPMILIANEVTDEAGLRWIADELRDPPASLMCCVDSADGVRLAAAALRGVPRPLPVLVELGHPGGRAGCRTIDEALMVAELVLVTPELVLAGASGYDLPGPRPGVSGRGPHVRGRPRRALPRARHPPGDRDRGHDRERRRQLVLRRRG
jgi:D-serine deaminase-like pyridoxal phosphate-dependent protein